MLAVDANTLDGCDDVVGMDVNDFRCNHDAREDLRICDGFLALPERREMMDGAHGERKVLVAVVLYLGGSQKIIKFGLLSKSGAARQREPSSRTVVRAQK